MPTQDIDSGLGRHDVSNRDRCGCRKNVARTAKGREASLEHYCSSQAGLVEKGCVNQMSWLAQLTCFAGDLLIFQVSPLRTQKPAGPF